MDWREYVSFREYPVALGSRVEVAERGVPRDRKRAGIVNSRVGQDRGIEVDTS